MRKWTWAYAAAALLAVALLVSSRSPRPARAAINIPLEFSHHAMWDNGKAEFTIYSTTGPKYGVARTYESRIIVVKEDMVANELVKSDSGAVAGRTFPVLKMNYLQDIPTGTYTYHQMVSVFFDRETFRPVKLAMGSMESCGLTYVVLKPSGTSLEHVSHSYWQGEGDRKETIPWGDDAIFYDALPVWLRGLDMLTPMTYRVRLLPSQLSNRVRERALVPATIVVAGRESSPSLSSRGGIRIDVRYEGKEDRFWFHPGPGHVLMRWEKADGTVLTMRKTLWLAYWEKHNPGDEALLQ